MAAPAPVLNSAEFSIPNFAGGLASHDMLEPLAKKSDEPIGMTSLADDDDRLMFEVPPLSPEVRIVLKSYSNVDGDEATILLQDLQPSYVVLYDADVAFIRAMEVYSSLKAEIAQLKADMSEKDAAMEAFQSGETRILVATTVRTGLGGVLTFKQCHRQQKATT